MHGAALGEEDTPHLDAAQELDSKDVPTGETTSPRSVLRPAHFTSLGEVSGWFTDDILKTGHPLLEAVQDTDSTMLSLIETLSQPGWHAKAA